MIRVSAVVVAALTLAACERQSPETEAADPDAAVGQVEAPADLVMPPEEAEAPPATGMEPGPPIPDTPPVLPPAEGQPEPEA